jgi:hypothetical protein
MPRFALCTRCLYLGLKTHDSLAQLIHGSRPTLEGAILLTEHLDGRVAFA